MLLCYIKETSMKLLWNFSVKHGCYANIITIGYFFVILEHSIWIWMNNKRSKQSEWQIFNPFPTKFYNVLNFEWLFCQFFYSISIICIGKMINLSYKLIWFSYFLLLLYIWIKLDEKRLTYDDMFMLIMPMD